MPNVVNAARASERSERATRTERAGAAARERACGGVRGAKCAALRANAVSEPPERSEAAERRASDGVGESEGRSPSVK